MSDTCPVCIRNSSGIIEDVSHKRATAAAHSIAMRIASDNNADDTHRMSFLDVYCLYFRRVYEHEYERSRRIEVERIVWKNLKTKGKCDYHSEFDCDFKFCKKVYQECERKYSTSKWPNPLL